MSVYTPSRFYPKRVLATLEADASVIYEEPPTMTADQAGRMAEIADKNGQISIYRLQHRFSNETTMIKSHLDALGDVYYVGASTLRRSGVPG